MEIEKMKLNVLSPSGQVMKTIETNKKKVPLFALVARPDVPKLEKALEFEISKLEELLKEGRMTKAEVDSAIKQHKENLELYKKTEWLEVGLSSVSAQAVMGFVQKNSNYLETRYKDFQVTSVVPA